MTYYEYSDQILRPSEGESGHERRGRHAQALGPPLRGAAGGYRRFLGSEVGCREQEARGTKQCLLLLPRRRVHSCGLAPGKSGAREGDLLLRPSLDSEATSQGERRAALGAVRGWRWRESL